LSDDFILRESVEHVVEVCQFVGQTGAADLSNLFYLHPEWFWPQFDVAVIFVENQCWRERQS
jgi:hypothetical protein